MPYQMPAVINTVGGIDLHGREGVLLTFKVGTLDLSPLDLWFEVDGVLRKQLTPGTAATEKIITISQEDVVAIWEAGVPNGAGVLFAVRAYNLSPPQVFWEGLITIRGYTQEPPL